MRLTPPDSIPVPEADTHPVRDTRPVASLPDALTSPTNPPQQPPWRQRTDLPSSLQPSTRPPRRQPDRRVGGERRQQRIPVTLNTRSGSDRRRGKRRNDDAPPGAFGVDTLA